MRVYLDMCCLKRPFDDQSNARNHVESEAVLALLARESTDLEFIRSPALALENSLNPVKERAARIAQWLEAGTLQEIDSTALQVRTAEIMQLGIRNFDALHIASAELSAANVFSTCDDRLLAAARRSSDQLQVRVLSIVLFAAEVLK